jgi:ankyrin repeat protein
VTTVNPVIFNDVADLCDNDRSFELDAALAHYPALIDVVDVNQRNLVHRAAEAGSSACIQVLKNHGANIKAQDVSGETPLHRAVYRRHLDAARALLALGADPNARNVYGGTPTLYAAGAGPDALDLLVEKGGNPLEKDNSGDGVIQWAERSERQNNALRAAVRAKMG